MFKKGILFISGLVLGASFCVITAQHYQKKIKVLKAPDTILGFDKIDPDTKKPYPITENKRFVIVIPSYNNEAYYEKNLQSVFDQKYENYRVIYIDDHSTDNTYQNVKNYVEKCGQTHRVQIIHNEKNCGALCNHYRAAHSAEDDEIIVHLDGDDWLAHSNVLNVLNQYYANPNIWMTWGNYITYPKMESVAWGHFYTKEVAQKGFRKLSWRSSHLRTCYAGLFKKIALKDFLHDGKWYSVAPDLAFMYPLLEMANPHFCFIPDILYIYNRENPCNEDQKNMQRLAAMCESICSLKPYKPLIELNRKKDTASLQKADLVVFSYNRPMQLYACLESVNKHVNDLRKITVIYRTSQAQYEEGYKEVKKVFPDVMFLSQGKEYKKDFKPLVLQAVFSDKEKCNYVLFCTDDILIKDHVDLKECIASMESSQAYGFYLRLGLHVDQSYMENCYQGIPTSVEPSQGIYAWQFNKGTRDWNYPNSVDMTLYRKSDIEAAFLKNQYSNPNELEGEWARLSDSSQIGLFYSSSKIVNIPMNRVSTVANRYSHSWTVEELEKKFEQGMKINIDTVYQIQNRSPHMDFEMTFIKR